MTESLREVFLSKPFKQWLLYYVRAYLIMLLLFLFSRTVSHWPAFVIFAFLALLSVYSMLGAEYRVVIRKAIRQIKYKERGKLARLNNGRIFSLIVCYVLSLVCMTSLLVQITRWQATEWVIACVSVPLFMGIFLLAQRMTKKEIEPVFQNEATIKISYIVVAIALALIYLGLFSQAGGFTTAEQAIQSVDYPFAHSSSVLISEMGNILNLIEGFSLFGMSAASGVSYWIEQIVRIVVCASAFLGIANLLATCALRTDDLVNVFRPLEVFKRWNTIINYRNKTTIAAIGISIVLPIATFIVLMYADKTVEDFAQTEGFSMYQQAVEREKKAICYVLDVQFVQKVKMDALKEVQEITNQSKEKMRDIINSTCDKQISNVDAYLEWYYRYRADIEKILMEDAEEAAKKKAMEILNEGVDLSALQNEYDSYKGQIENVKQWYTKTLESAGIQALNNAGLGADELADLETIFKPFSLTVTLFEGDGLLSGGGEGIFTQTKDFIVNDILHIQQEGFIDRETRRQMIVDEIEKTRAEALESLE